MAEKTTNAGILCIDDNDSRAKDRQKSLENAGCVVMRAGCEAEALELLKSRQVDVVFVDSSLLHVGATAVGAGIKHLRPHVWIVLICDSGMAPASCQEHVDVLIDESAFNNRARWLIDELRDVHFPFCTECFDDRKPRASNSRSNEASTLTAVSERDVASD